MKLSDLREIQKNWGFLSPEGVSALAEVAPNTGVVIRFGYGPRVSCSVSEVEKTIRASEREYKEMKIDQYVRDVFIPATSLDKICEVFGWPKQ